MGHSKYIELAIAVPRYQKQTCLKKFSCQHSISFAAIPFSGRNDVSRLIHDGENAVFTLILCSAIVKLLKPIIHNILGAFINPKFKNSLFTSQEVMV
jgi:hypothetical protein